MACMYCMLRHMGTRVGIGMSIGMGMGMSMCIYIWSRDVQIYTMHACASCGSGDAGSRWLVGGKRRRLT